ncbi:MAG: hypothetical protein HY261_04195, partial [Chloroflexi bacterium]|nr:hypothetical protein [Chloroflexota bacterium]
MAKKGLKFFDSDLHIVEPADLWQRYTDKDYRATAPRGLADLKWDIRVEVDGQVFPRLWPTDPQVAKKDQAMVGAKYKDEIAAGFSAKAQVGAMRKEGIDTSVLFPSRGLWANAVDGMEPKRS